MRAVLLNQLEEILFYSQSLRHNINHICNDHSIPQAVNILQAATSLPKGNTTFATVSLFCLKHHETLIFLSVCVIEGAYFQKAIMPIKLWSNDGNLVR